MWQEVVALDSKVCDLRFNKMSTKEKQDLKPMYLKRRLQLLQGGNQTTEIDHQTEEQEEGQRVKEYRQSKYQPVMRNKRYISLRVKLLKRQFGLPSDVLSLGSLTLSPDCGGHFNRVHHIFDSLHKAQVGRLLMVKDFSGSNNNNNNSNNVQLISCSLDGSLAITNLNDFGCKVLQHPDGVVDFDISTSPHDLLASACVDGSLLLWHLKTGQELRRQGSEGLTRSARVTGVRFLPQNNNLVVCSTSSGLLRVLNVSTGKFSNDGHATGKTNCMEIRDSLLWVGGDRGYIESFKLDRSGKILKGCRVPVQPQQPVISISTTDCTKMLAATLSNSQNLYLFKISGDIGTVSPFRAFNAGPDSGALRFVTLLPGPLAACGSDDGSVLFFDLEKNTKPCIDKLTGHSKPVSNVSFSDDRSLLVSADLSGQIIVWKKS